MNRVWQPFLLFFVPVLMLACVSLQVSKPSTPTVLPKENGEIHKNLRVFDNGQIKLQYPGDWRTLEEVFGRPSAKTHDKEFDSDILLFVTNNSPSSFGDKYTAWCSLMQKPKDSSSTLQKEMDSVYELLKNYSYTSLAENEIQINGINAIEKIYKRPRGEPWYQVRDVWIPQNSTLIILSCYSNPNSYDQNFQIFQQILESIQIKS